MSLESKINNLIMPLGYVAIEIWPWFGPNQDWIKEKDVKKQFYSLIHNAAFSECLTSSSEYIREYRKWWEDDS